MKNFELKNIPSELEGYKKIIELYRRLADSFFEDYVVEINTWFSANVCSLLGALLYKIANDPFSGSTRIKSDLDILKKNNFLFHYGHPILLDNYETTIAYKVFDKQDDNAFKNYINENIMGRNTVLHEMDNNLKERIVEAFFEIFINAQMHSKTEKIFTCGQLFPTKKQFEFMISDVGIGIKKSIAKNFGIQDAKKINPAKAIEWAVEQGNTAKNGIPGGHGLAIIKEFIQENNGTLQILSDNGYYEYKNQSENTKRLDYHFEGTMINLKIDIKQTIDTYIDFSEINF